jgi:hypothetical protein
MTILMKLPSYFALLVLPVLTACNSGNMTVSSFDGQTGTGTTTEYSKYYDKGVWLLNEKLGLEVVVDHQKLTIPVAHGVAQSLGALGPSDSLASGKLTLYLWNFDSQAHEVVLQKVVVPSGSLDFNNQKISAQPNDRTGIEAGSFPISNYGKSISCKLEVQVDGRAQRLQIELPRFTTTQQKAYYSPGGHLPHPWGNRSLAR